MINQSNRRMSPAAVLIWRRSLFAASVTLIFLSLFIPGGWGVWVWFENAGTLSHPALEFELAVQRDIGVFGIVLGAFIIACLCVAFARTGRLRLIAIVMGCVAAGGVGILGVLVSMIANHPGPFGVLAPGAIATCAALLWERPRPTPGLCTTCGYDLTGLDDGALCPECGSAKGEG